MGNKIGAILVLYYPDIETLYNVLDNLSNQVDEICIVDNSFVTHANLFVRYANIHYKPLYKNVGIAAAQNIGIFYFLEAGFDYVLLIDQDSILSINTVRQLYDAFVALQSCNYKIAAIGSRNINRKNGLFYPPKSKEISVIRKETIGGGSDIIEYYSIISSVSLIPINNFLLVGGMDESLFIDGVDHEWCWRAWHKANLRSFIVKDAYIYHQFGEGDKKIATRSVSIASPFRVYFQFRNYLWLCRRKYTPFFWKIKHLIKYMIKIFYFPICVTPRMLYIKNILRGICDGIFKYNKLKTEWPTFQKKKD